MLGLDQISKFTSLMTKKDATFEDCVPLLEPLFKNETKSFVIYKNTDNQIKFVKYDFDAKQMIEFLSKTADELLKENEMLKEKLRIYTENL